MDKQLEYLKKTILTSSWAHLNTLLLNKALQHLQKAKVAILENNISERSLCNKKVMDIITFLACDLENYGNEKLVEVVGKLYLAVLQALPKIDFSNDPKVVDDFIKVLETQLEAWKSISEKENSQEKQYSSLKEKPVSGNAPYLKTSLMT